MEGNLLTTKFYKLPEWIIKIEGLQPADWIVYCVAYSYRKLSEKNKNIDEDGRVFFYLTYDVLKDKLGMGRRQVQNSLKRLKMCGAIIGERRVGRATRYFLETDPANIIFDIGRPQKDTSPNGVLTMPQKEPLVDPEEHFSKAPKGPISKIEYIKIKTSKIDEVRKGLHRANITPLLREKLMEYAYYRERMGKGIQSYDSIKLIINQIGSTFRDEQHLIDSINETFMYEYQGIFPSKLKKVAQPTGRVEGAALRRLRQMMEDSDEG